MRAYTTIGDIFRVQLENSDVRFFQYIAKDSSNLNADVIRVFKHHYCIEDDPLIETVLKDSIDFHAHTIVRNGIKLGLWEKYGSHGVSEDVCCNVIFRDSLDYGKHPKQHYVSKQWVVWKINGPRVFVGELPPEYYSADVGMVCAPDNIVKRLILGKFHHVYYPSY